MTKFQLFIHLILREDAHRIIGELVTRGYKAEPAFRSGKIFAKDEDGALCHVMALTLTSAKDRSDSEHVDDIYPIVDCLGVKHYSLMVVQGASVTHVGNIKKTQKQTPYREQAHPEEQK